MSPLLRMTTLPWAVVGAGNAALEPATRRGWLAPPPIGVGVVRIEAVGRRTGNRRARPVVAFRLAHLLVVGTARRRSDWIANLVEDPRPPVTLRDGEHVVDATVVRLAPLGTVAVLEVGADDVG